jgi:hypothetical protein
MVRRHDGPQSGHLQAGFQASRRIPAFDFLVWVCLRLNPVVTLARSLGSVIALCLAGARSNRQGVPVPPSDVRILRAGGLAFAAVVAGATSDAPPARPRGRAVVRDGPNSAANAGLREDGQREG